MESMNDRMIHGQCFFGFFCEYQYSCVCVSMCVLQNCMCVFSSPDDKWNNQMFMVRKMAIGSSGDPVCECAACTCECVTVCPCHTVRCKVVINNSTQRNGAEAIQVLSASRERVGDKAVKVRNMHMIFFFYHTHIKSTRFFKQSLGSVEGQRQCMAGCLATPEMKKVKIRQGFRIHSDFHQKRLITAV